MLDPANLNLKRKNGGCLCFTTENTECTVFAAYAAKRHQASA